MDFTWNIAHSQLIVDNWLENGFWNERGISFLNPPSIEFLSLISRYPYVSFPCEAQLFPFVLAKALGEGHPQFLSYLGAGMAWCHRIALDLRPVTLSAHEKEPERTLGAFLPGFL
jgi:hypothetical protein